MVSLKEDVQSLIAMYQESYCKALYSRLDLCDIPDFWHRVNIELTLLDFTARVPRARSGDSNLRPPVPAVKAA